MLIDIARCDSCLCIMSLALYFTRFNYISLIHSKRLILLHVKREKKRRRKKKKKEALCVARVLTLVWYMLFLVYVILSLGARVSRSASG